MDAPFTNLRMELSGHEKGPKKILLDDFAFFFIFNSLSAAENGGTSLCRENSE